MAIEYPASYWKDYELLDSGNGEKLERFGAYVLRRPEPKALWTPSLSEAEWKRLLHVTFRPGAGFGKAGKEDSGTWERSRRMEDNWVINYNGLPDADTHAASDLHLSLRLGLTSFKHVGVFPEQAPNWEFIFRETSRLVRIHKANGLETPRVLNLFAYTGAASLAAKCAGADVTHLDSVRQVVSWARDNMERSGLDGIRWVVEDALKFARREARRGRRYDGIILDPPAYGHGPDGEKWKLDELLFGMLQNVAEILSPRDSFMVLNLYSNGYSAALGETIVREAFKGAAAGAGGAASAAAGAGGASAGAGGAAASSAGRAFTSLESGELALADGFGKSLPLSIYVRAKL
ncbi:MAG: RsmD family RNA methyltransferase [Bacteroidales bacterium]|nr:RsmD family RNA methyltransferase [Bacteroidales bacterium]